MLRKFTGKVETMTCCMFWIKSESWIYLKSYWGRNWCLSRIHMKHLTVVEVLTEVFDVSLDECQLWPACDKNTITSLYRREWFVTQGGVQNPRSRNSKDKAKLSRTRKIFHLKELKLKAERASALADIWILHIWQQIFLHRLHFTFPVLNWLSSFVVWRLSHYKQTPFEGEYAASKDTSKPIEGE